MLGNYRANDIVLVIQQDNIARRIDLLSMNENASHMLGYGASMEGKPLSALLPERIAGLLNEYVEYSDQGNDVARVLGRVSDFHLLDHAGNALPFFPKLIPGEATEGKIAFHLLLQPRAAPREGVQLRAAMAEHMPDADNTPLPRQRLAQQIEAWQSVEEEARLPSALCMMMIDQHEQIMEWHGKKAVQGLLDHVAQAVRQKLRGYDYVLTMEPHSLGVVMLDVESDIARLVLNRLRWETASLPVSIPGVGQVSTTLSAAFAPLDMAHPPEAQLRECERLLAEGHRTAPNQLWASAA